MKTRRTVLCDLVRVVDAGKVDLLGVFDKFLVKVVPTALPAFSLHTLIVADTKEEIVPGQSNLSIAFVNEDEEVLTSVDGPLPDAEVGELSSDKRLGVAIVLTFTGVKVEKFGKYRVRIAVDGNLLEEVPVWVEERSAKP